MLWPIFRHRQQLPIEALLSTQVPCTFPEFLCFTDACRDVPPPRLAMHSALAETEASSWTPPVHVRVGSSSHLCLATHIFIIIMALGGAANRDRDQNSA